MGEFSIMHLLVIGGIVLFFFGPTRLPALGQSLGKAIRGFKQGLNEIDAEAKPVVDNKTQTPEQLSAAQAQAEELKKEKEAHKV